MKILDRYILTSYLKTFFSVFIILVLIFVLQTIWLYIKELAGKDLDIGIIAKFLLYILPKLIPLVLPLTILLASIMVFGSFAENYEFAAMKSTGISLRRAMSGLSIFIVLLAALTFLFSNNVIPWAEYNSYNLRKNIAKIKPAMAIAQGQFNPIGDDGTTIKVEEKSGDRGQYLKDVVIHKKGEKGKKNTTTIIAETGEIVSSDSTNVLKLILHNGNYYEDILTDNYNEKQKRPFAKSSFKTYIINIDLSEFNNVDVDDKNYDNKYNMLNVSSLDYTIDSLTQKRTKNHKLFSKKLYQNSNIYQRDFSKKIDDVDDDLDKEQDIKSKEQKTKYKQELIINKDSIYNKNIFDLITNSQTRLNIINTALSNINSSKQLIARKKASLKPQKSHYNRHIISFHEKFALCFACIILFFVGAPLGALIRKGGLGLPMVIAILLFLTYHFIGIFATNSAKNGSFNPILATWFSTLIMLPLSIFLTKRATEDKALFDMDNITEPLKKMFNINQKNNDTFLRKQTNKQLVDTINKTDLIEPLIKYDALTLLNTRGLTTKDLNNNQIIGIKTPFFNKQNIVKHFNQHTVFSISLYSIALVLFVLFFVFKNNKLPALATFSIQISAICALLYLIYYFKTIFNLINYYNKNTINKKPNVVLLIIGLPLYMLGYFYTKSKIQNDLKLFFSNHITPLTNNNAIHKSLNRLETTKNLDKGFVLSKTEIQANFNSTKKLKANTLYTITTYITAVVLCALFFILKNNKAVAVAYAAIQLSLISAILYCIYYIKSVINIFTLYKNNKLKLSSKTPLFIIGLPIYPLAYFIIKKTIKQGLEKNNLESLK